MNFIRLVIFSLCVGIAYFALSIAAIGQSAAGNVFWWFNISGYPTITHLAQNFVGIGLVAFIPAFVIKSYEPGKQWLAMTVVVLATIFLHGNLQYMPWDPMGIVRFIFSTLLSGDIGATVMFFYITLLPVLWLWILKRAARV